LRNYRNKRQTMLETIYQHYNNYHWAGGI
jgi:hypothetical protein